MFDSSAQGKALGDLSGEMTEDKVHDISEALLLFDGRSPRWVEAFAGERFSVVFLVCPGFERASAAAIAQLVARGSGLPCAAAVERAATLSLERHSWAESPLGRPAAAARCRARWGARLEGPGDDEPLHDHGTSLQDADTRLQLRAHRAYEAAGLVRAEHKSFTREVRFKAWGRTLMGWPGTLARRRTVATSSCEL